MKIPAVIHVVALSGGKDSTAMALRLKELNPTTPYRYICTPTGRELPEMFEHWKKLGSILGHFIEPIMHPLGLTGLIEHYNALPNFRQRWCTRQLKIEPYEKWLIEQRSKYDKVISYVGLRADEEDREGGDYSKVDGVESVFPLRDWNWGINEVVAYLEEKQITIPKRTDCDCCFFQRISEWYNLWKNHPKEWEESAALERKTGHTFRSPSRDTWPAALDDLAKEFASGRPIRERKKDALTEMQCRVCRT